MHDKPIAVITNATEYAGPGSVEALVQEGFQLVCQDAKLNDKEACDIYESQGSRVVSMTVTPEALIEDAMDRYGRIDAVISNDYLMTRATEIDQLSSGEFRDTIEALTLAPFRLCSAAAAIRKSKGAVLWFW